MLKTNIAERQRLLNTYVPQTDGAEFDIKNLRQMNGQLFGSSNQGPELSSQALIDCC